MTDSVVEKWWLHKTQKRVLLHFAFLSFLRPFFPSGLVPEFRSLLSISPGDGHVKNVPHGERLDVDLGHNTGAKFLSEQRVSLSSLKRHSPRRTEGCKESRFSESDSLHHAARRMGMMVRLVSAPNALATDVMTRC